MRIRSALGTSFLFLTMASASWTWQTTSTAPQPGGAVVPRRVEAPAPSQVGPQRGNAFDSSRSSVYPEERGRMYSAPTRPDFPQYPYPRYHNPYFDGADAKNFFSNVFDWVFRLPSNLVNRFSDYVDTTFFPPTPATHGRSVQPARPSQRRPGSLPPAARFEPTAR